MTLGDSIEKLAEFRDKKDGLTAELSELNKEIDAIEFNIIQEMERLGLSNVKSPKGTAIRQVSLYPQVKDMEAFANWAVENGKTEMIQKRVSGASFKEYFEQTGAYPDGVDAYQKSSINFRRSK